MHLGQKHFHGHTKISFEPRTKSDEGQPSCVASL